jgi:hypothetical protein
MRFEGGVSRPFFHLRLADDTTLCEEGGVEYFEQWFKQTNSIFNTGPPWRAVITVAINMRIRLGNFMQQR